MNTRHLLWLAAFALLVAILMRWAPECFAGMGSGEGGLSVVPAPSNGTNTVGSGAATVTISNNTVSVYVPDLSPTLASHATHLTTLDTRATMLEKNDILGWVEQQIADGLTRVALADGYKDFFTDQSGVNLAVSSNQTWSAGTYSWSAPTLGRTESVMLHLDGADGSTSIIDATTFSSWSMASAYITNAPGKFSGCLYLDGTANSHADSADNIPFDFGTGDFTVDAWVYLASDPSGLYNPHVVRHGSVWQLFIRDSRELAWVSGAYQTTAKVALNAWQHVAVVRTNGTVVLFINGTNSYSTSLATDYTGTGGADIGYGGGDGQFPGYIDELRVVKSARWGTANFSVPASAYAADGAPTGGNMLLVATNSAASLLDFTPSEGRLGLWLSTNSGPIAMNTDLKGYLSRATPTNWVQVTFSDSTGYTTNASDVIWFTDTTNLPGSGSNVLWKIETANTNTAGQVKGAFPQAR